MKRSVKRPSSRSHAMTGDWLGPDDGPAGDAEESARGGTLADPGFAQTAAAHRRPSRCARRPPKRPQPAPMLATVSRTNGSAKLPWLT